VIKTKRALDVRRTEVRLTAETIVGASVYRFGRGDGVPPWPPRRAIGWRL